MNIITVTVNPAIDKSAKVDGLVAEQKLRCHSINSEAGGGGINISRILVRLKVNNKCLFTSGGDNGRNLEQMLINEMIDIIPVDVKQSTRENLSVTDTLTNAQYRFGMPGKEISKVEQTLIIETIKENLKDDDILILSGSLSQNMPSDYYYQIIKSLSSKRLKIIVDTSGEALLKALETPLYLIKPNQRELALLAGKEFLSNKEQESFAMELVNSGKVAFVVVSLGARGALMASKQGLFYQTTPSIPVKSTIGAGDSMVAGLVYGITQNLEPKQLLKYGVACGAATTMSDGTALASKETIDYILNLLG